MKHFFTGLLALAACVASTVSASAEGIEPNSVELSLGFGYGHFDSPIEGESDRDFYFLPDLVWYGERAYFDNGLFGYALSESKTQQWDLVLYPNEDGLIFNLSGSSVFILVNAPFDPDAPVTVVDTIDRRVSGMAGLRYSWQGETFSAYLEIAGDVTNVHNGWELGTEIGLGEPLRWQSLLINAFIGVRFKDTNLVDYYYTPQHGEIMPAEGLEILIGETWGTVGPYNGEDGWLAHWQIDVWWPLAEQWAIRATARENYYSDSIADSVIVKQRRFGAGFLGLEYRF